MTLFSHKIANSQPSKPHRYALSIACVLGLTLFCHNTAATIEQDRLFELTLEQLLAVKVVTTSKRAERKADSPAVISVLSRREIDLLGITHTQQAIEYIAGLSSVNGEGNVFTTTTIMGNTLVNYNTNTLLLLDGNTLLSPYHGSFDFAAIPLSAVSRIEVIKGANSVLYGTNAINAVINVITKAKVEDSQSNFNVFLGSKAESNIALSYQNHEKSFSFTGQITETGGENLDLNDESGRTAVLDPNVALRNLNLQYGWEKFGFYANYFSRKLANYRTKGFTDIQHNEESGLLLVVDYRHKFDNNHQVDIKLQNYSWWLDKHFTVFSDLEQFEWEYEATRSAGQVEYSYSGEAHFMTAGFELTENVGRRYKEDISDYDIGKFNEPTSDSAYYLNGTWFAQPSTELHYGARYYSSTFFDGLSQASSNFSNTSIRGAVVHRLAPEHVLKLNYGQAFRVPTYFEKQVSSETVQGNINLSPEKSESISLVYSHISKYGSFDLSLFKTKIDEKITRVPVSPGSDIFQNANIGSIAFSGIEAEAKYSISNRLWGFSGITFNQSDQKQDAILNDWMVTGGLQYQMAAEHKLNLSYKYLSQWKSADSYLMLNTAYVYQLDQHQLNVGVHNLFDESRELPEIARQMDEVLTIPVVSRRDFYVSYVYQF
jgi:outer membrane receptor for ferrienterochelin and colicins